MAGEVSQVFHLAASVDFALPLAESRAANVDSSREVLAFCRACAWRGKPDFRPNYVSTAYVAGRRQGWLTESERNCGQAFWNAYEQSKLEGEEMAAAAMDEIALTIYRPSQIIGESRSGRIRKFFGYYEFLKLAERDRMPVLLADPGARPDLVPTDYVCDAMLHLSERPEAAGRVYHLTAGLSQSLSFERIFGLMYQVLAERGGGVRQPRRYRHGELEALATPAELQRYHLSPLKLLQRTYRPYLDSERDFDCAATQRELAAAGIVLPDIERTLRLSTGYALDSRYGTAGSSAAANLKLSDRMQDGSHEAQVA
ncbi:hypothetical protein BI347_10450 [Chromobacterium sphagni]|uniref:Thioester reductase (TE) domain-containing protein n=1 Tax=Chromobacterium sphagni TaxID=1903179 RepID=A0A1S1X317_9NEIS|nr:hypothetical protein BI347_10450 [Chromobacterium sphagni]